MLLELTLRYSLCTLVLNLLSHFIQALTNAGKSGIVTFYHEQSTSKSESSSNDRAIAEFYDTELGLKSSWMYFSEFGDNIGKTPYAKFPSIAGYGPYRLLKSGTNESIVFI